MHVGMKEAVAHRMAQEALDDDSTELRQVVPLLGQSRDVRELRRRRSIRGSALRRRCGPNRSWGRENRSSRATLSANSEAAAASSRKSVSIRRLRARVSTTPVGLRRRVSGNVFSIKVAAVIMSARSRCSSRSTPGRAHLDGHFALAQRVAHPALVNLRDRGGGDRLTDLDEQRFDLLAEEPLRSAGSRRRGGTGPSGPAAAPVRARPAARRHRGASRGIGRALHRTARAC